MTIVEERRVVTGGVDTHLDLHVCAALDQLGSLLGTQPFETTPAGYKELFGWLASFGDVSKVGIEGTGSYGAGLARFLTKQGIQIVEVDRQNRQARRTAGKTDTLDAIEAARAALGGRATGQPKTRDGAVEAIRVLVVAKRSARLSRSQALSQIRQLGTTGPEQLRCRLKGLSIPNLVGETAKLRPTKSSDPVTAATKVSLSSLARRIQHLDKEIAELEAQIQNLMTAAAPELLSATGIGFDTGAALLVAAGDNPHRLTSEAKWAHLCGVAPIQASSGKVVRHRLDRGGDRHANSALWRIVMVRLRYDPETQAYMARRLKEGRSKKEIIRILKRYVAREVYSLLPRI